MTVRDHSSLSCSDNCRCHRSGRRYSRHGTNRSAGRPPSRNGGRLEPELSHHGQQIGLLNRLLQRASEHIAPIRWLSARA